MYEKINKKSPSHFLLFYFLCSHHAKIGVEWSLLSAMILYSEKEDTPYK